MDDAVTVVTVATSVHVATQPAFEKRSGSMKSTLEYPQPQIGPHRGALKSGWGVQSPTQLLNKCVASVVCGRLLNTVRQMRGSPVLIKDQMRPLAPIERKRASIRERNVAIVRVGACIHPGRPIVERVRMPPERSAA